MASPTPEGFAALPPSMLLQVLSIDGSPGLRGPLPAAWSALGKLSVSPPVCRPCLHVGNNTCTPAWVCAADISLPPAGPLCCELHRA